MDPSRPEPHFDSFEAGEARLLPEESAPRFYCHFVVISLDRFDLSDPIFSIEKIAPV